MMIDAVSQTLMGVSTARTFFEWSRLHQLTEWWHWLLLVIVCLTVATYVFQMYRRDTLELPRGVRWGLMLLRLTALCGLLIFFLDLQKRTETENIRTSRVALLIDTSQSMGLADVNQDGRVMRLKQIADALSQGKLIDRLLDKHDINVYRFDQTSTPTQVASFTKHADAESKDVTEAESSGRDGRLARRFYRVAVIVAALALLMLVGQSLVGRRARGAEGEAYLLLFGCILLVVSLVLAGVTNLRYPDITLAQVLGQMPPASEPVAAAPIETDPDPGVGLAPSQIDWDAELTPRGVETRLGEALRWTIDKERDGPLAGIIIVTDGCHNAGITPESVIPSATTAEVPLFPIGIGSEKQPRNIRLVDLELPQRVYPGDRFTITGYVQANGLAGRTIRLSLEQRTMDDQPTELALERRVTLQPDGVITPIQFEVTPDEVGRFKWLMQVTANERDDLDPRDNSRQGTVQVVERKSRVLLLAGGPTREYRFLRNLLFRSATTQVDVLLQSAPVGAAQEAHDVLDEFPSDRDKMFQYDCLVAFDPDWTALTSDQVHLIDEWVAEKAGGLIVVAGPVFTSSWTRGSRSPSDERTLQGVRDLYPVTFYRRGAASIKLNRISSDTPWPLRFTDEGLRSQFLWLEDSPTGSETAWTSFSGVYGYQGLRGIKPGAQVYARFSDPQASIQEELPVYMAGQFYGAGRVFYLGSGEMWRLNELDTRYFDTFYTKLIRHVSQGRLLRDSSRGLLLVDQERCSLGDTVTVRAALTDEQYRPLSLDSVDATLVHDDGLRQPLRLKRLANSERPGMYSGQFTAMRKGDLRIDLAIPGVDDEMLSREVKVRIPALEIEHPQRNDALLSNLAKQTSGAYSVGLDAAIGVQGAVPIANRIPAKDQTTYLPGTPDRQFEQRLMGWLMALICGALCLEWFFRRLYKLA